MSLTFAQIEFKTAAEKLAMTQEELASYSAKQEETQKTQQRHRPEQARKFRLSPDRDIRSGCRPDRLGS